MGDIKEELDVDIQRFIEQIDGQCENDKRETLRNLFKKYMHLNSCDLVLDHTDFQLIVNHAKQLFVDRKMPVHLGPMRKAVSGSENANYCLILSTIMYLNKNNCLTKNPVFDEKEDKI